MNKARVTSMASGLAVAMLSIAATSGTAHAALLYDQNVTNNVIMGTGIGNGGFTVNTASGIELGLRARERYPTPTGLTNSNGDGTYNHDAGGFTSGGAPGGTRAAWNFDWSINTGTAMVGAYTYKLGIDYDPGFATNYQVFDPIHSPNPAAGGAVLWDHSFGTNATAQSAGVEASGGNLAALLASYNALVVGNNLAQNSWNLDFYDDALHVFDPNANGNYSIYLEAYNAAGDTLLARTEIEVIVGTGAVPEPATLALLGLGLLGLAGMRRKS